LIHRGLPQALIHIQNTITHYYFYKKHIY